MSPPPDVFFEWVAEKDREAARGFYRKFINIKGLPVAASGDVADQALQRTHTLVTRMLAGRPDVFAAMVTNRMYLIIIGKDQRYTDMPEYRNHPDPEFQNERVRGTGGRPTSFGEENLLSLPVDRYDDESIAVHEFAHTIDGTLRGIEPGWIEKRNAVYGRALEKGLWRQTYAGSNPGEYWAELCQSYFDCNRVNNWNHGPIGTREQLRIYDPKGYELVRDTLRLGPGQDWRYSFPVKLPTVAAPPARFHIDPYYTKFTLAREFVIVGREARNEALLKANDILRKMFAYRHDLLKTLIQEEVKLVVLGRNESLANLPEWEAWDRAVRVDAHVRFMEFHPRTRWLVVGEETVLGDPSDPAVGECLIPRLFARAVHQLAGTRPVDPEWDNRGRALQQYELRVKRLDLRFDQRLKVLHAEALSAGRWKGTPAVHDPSGYWAEGAAAYFDALGQRAAPADSPSPILTREALRAYDPGLHDLVHETFAFEGRVDWRLQRE